MVTLRKLSLFFLGLSLAGLSYGMNPNNNQDKFLILLEVGAEIYNQEFGNEKQHNFNQHNEEISYEDNNSSEEYLLNDEFNEINIEELYKKKDHSKKRSKKNKKNIVKIKIRYQCTHCTYWNDNHSGNFKTHLKNGHNISPEEATLIVQNQNPQYKPKKPKN